MSIDPSWYIQPEDIPESTSAGGIVIRLEGGQAWIALVKEGDYPDYILPKGRVESDENLEAAARREIMEEAGIGNLELVDYLGIKERLSFNKRKWIRTHYFLFVTKQLQVKPTDPDHNYRSEWFSIHELPIMFWPEQRRLVAENLRRIEALANSEPYISARSRRPPE